MKKVLIIAHLLHAFPRIPGLAKYLPEFGWQPIIMTSPLGERTDLRLGLSGCSTRNVKVVETSYYDALGFLRRLFGFSSGEPIDRLAIGNRLGTISGNSSIDFVIGLGGAIICYPDEERGWKSYAIKTGSELLQEENIDAMISSSPPVTSHIVAKHLKNKYKVQWIADLRDLWSQNANYSYGPIRNLVDRKLELRTLSAADSLVTVSHHEAEKLKMLHKREVLTVTNGFDPDRMSDGKTSLTSKFAITYTGRIYKGRQDPSKFLAALKDLISDGTMNSKDVEVRFFGPESVFLDKAVRQHGLSDIVKQYGTVSWSVSIEKQKESQLLLLFNWENREDKGVYTLKIFEYLAAQRPIIATGGFGSDAVKALLEETISGRYCPTVEDIRKILRESYSEYKSHGKITYGGQLDKISKYNYREMARKFAEILNTLVRDSATQECL